VLLKNVDHLLVFMTAACAMQRGSRPSRCPSIQFVRWLALALMLAAPTGAAAGQVRVPARGGVAELRAEQQRVEGKVFYADGNVEIRYQNLRLRADHVEYNSETGQAAARGNVRFEMDSQFIEASDATYNLRTERGLFRDVRGEIRAQRRPNPNVLLSDNPVTFAAKEVERVDASTYEVRSAWLTVCEPDKPIWKFYAPKATIRLGKSVVLLNANFRLLSIPILYLPVASAPVGRRVRQSGFLVPHFANTTRKGFVFGDAFYWAPAEWMDLTLGAELLSRRGWSQTAELRARPWEEARLEASFFNVVDRGLPGPGGVRIPQGGNRTRVLFDAYLPDGWRAVADVNTLSALRFRLAFSETFAEAVNSEVRTSAFVTNSFRGMRLDFSALNYKNFLSADPETAVVLRAAPGARFSVVDQAPWKRVPVYFGLQASADAVHRSDPNLETATAVQRSEIAPRVTVPLRWGPWLGITPTFTFRTTRYGSQQLAGTVVGDSVRRTTGELTVDVRPPALARIWEADDESATKWKHTVEPQIEYRFVEGVDRFGRFLRFDEYDTLTNTNEVYYAVAQRLFRRRQGGNAEELLLWRVSQKYYFDPTFDGAIVPGQRNVFQALNSITPFAFADGTRRFSPVASDLRITPGKRYDAQFRVDIDPSRSRMTAFGTLVNVRPYSEMYVTLAHFATRANNVLQPRSNQVRGLIGYGDINRKGFNGSFGISYDVRQEFVQNQVVQFSYNGNCCGIAFEFRRLALGPVRSENQFRVALLIANIGTFGNLRRQEKIF
jgi:LPS-assembly protein